MANLTKIVVEDYSLEDGVFTCFATDFSTHQVQESRALLAYQTKDMDHVESNRKRGPWLAYRHFEDWLADAAKAPCGKGAHKEACALLSEIVNEMQPAVAVVSLPSMPHFAALLNSTDGLIRRLNAAAAGYNPVTLPAA